MSLSRFLFVRILFSILHLFLERGEGSAVGGRGNKPESEMAPIDEIISLLRDILASIINFLLQVHFTQGTRQEWGTVYKVINN